MQYLPTIGLILSMTGTILLLADRLWQEPFTWKFLKGSSRFFEWINFPHAGLVGLVALLFGFALQLIGVVNLGISYTVRIDWQAVVAVGTLLAAFGTFSAVVVALLPILRENFRRNTEARLLRVRLCTALFKFRPTLLSIMTPPAERSPIRGVFTREGFVTELRPIHDMFHQSSVLERNEQDHLVIVFTNLEQAAVRYSTHDLNARTARQILASIDRAIEIMGKDLVSDEVYKPWEHEIDNQVPFSTPS